MKILKYILAFVVFIPYAYEQAIIDFIYPFEHESSEMNHFNKILKKLL